MDWNSAVKYAAAGLIMGSLLLLVLNHQMDSQAYITLAIGALAGLGGHAAGQQSKSGPATSVSPGLTVGPKRD
jgi:hypothetical protein